jgi:hypothetical protein
MSSAYVSAIVVAASAFLAVISSGVAFVGSRRDVTAIQTKILRKHPHVTPPVALDQANRQLNLLRRGYFIAWILGGILAAVAIFLAATANSSPQQPTSPSSNSSVAPSSS